MQSSKSPEKRPDLRDDVSNAEPPAEFIAANSVCAKHSIHGNEQTSSIAVGGERIM